MDLRVGVQLKSLANIIMRNFDSHTGSGYLDSLTGMNCWILGYLAEHEDRDVYQRDLEGAFGVTRSTASKVVELMVRKGLITKQTVSHDGRLRKLTLTDRSRELTAMMRREHAAMEETLTRGFSDEEKERLCSYLERMKHNILADKDAGNGGNQV